MTRTVLVTGARGKTGREVVERLRRHPEVVVRAGSSRPEAETPFSWEDRATWPAATDGVDAVYLVRPDVPDAPELVAGLVAGLVELNPAAHTVLLSEQGAEGLAAGVWARRVEDAVTARARSWTVLRPSWFQQVLTDPRFYRDGIRDHGVLGLPSGGAPIAWVDTRDIAAVAVAALLAPGEHAGQAYTLTGPAAVTVDEVAAELSRHVGHPVRAEDPPPEQAVEGLDPWTTEILVDLFERVRTGGFATLSPTVERVTGAAPVPVGDFVAENADGWRRQRTTLPA